MRRIILAAMALLLVSAVQSNAYILDEYFGVNLSVSGGNFNMPWTPVRGFMMNEDWGTGGDAPDPGPDYSVSEAFDIEAMYLDYDLINSQIVFSIVTSMPNTGFSGVPWFPGYLFRAGDIRFNIGSNLYVLSTFNGTYAGYGYSAGQLYLNPDMGYYDDVGRRRGFAERGNPVLANHSQNGNLLGTTAGFEFGYLNRGLTEKGYGTYLMEGRINFSDLFDDPVYNTTMTLGMSCNNDVAVLDAVPEPTTMVLMSLGLIGLYGGHRRFRK